eukprot:1610040-Alexandrium_andersonii.AAC.1
MSPSGTRQLPHPPSTLTTGAAPRRVGMDMRRGVLRRSPRGGMAACLGVAARRSTDTTLEEYGYGRWCTDTTLE